jgi:hypothetical protein
VVIVYEKQSNDSSRVEGYFKGHIPVHIPCIEVWIGLKNLATVIPLLLPLPFVLMLIPFYVALLSAFSQDLEDLVIYDPFWIIYRPISYFQFLDSAMSLFLLDLLLEVAYIIFWFLIHYNPCPILLWRKKKKIHSVRYSNNV